MNEQYSYYFIKYEIQFMMQRIRLIIKVYVFISSYSSNTLKI